MIEGLKCDLLEMNALINSDSSKSSISLLREPQIIFNIEAYDIIRSRTVKPLI